MPLPRVQLNRRIIPIAAAQAIGVSCGVIGVGVVSRHIPPEALGDYGLYLTFTTLGMWLVHSGLVKFVNRHWAAEVDRPALQRRVGRAWLAKFPWLVLASAAGAAYISSVGGTGFLSTFVPLTVSAAGLSLIAAAQGALQADRAHYTDLVVAAFGSVGRTFAAPLFFIVFSGVTAALYWGFAVHTIVVSAIALALWRRAARQTGDAGATETPSGEVYFGAFFTVLAFANWSLYGVNRWIVAWRFDEVTTGYFTFAGSIGALVPAVLGGIAVQYSQPGIYRLADQSAGQPTLLVRRVDLVAGALAVAGLAGIIALRLLAPHLVGTLIHPRYVPALPWIVPTGCFGLTIATAQFYSIMLLARRKERACGPVELSTAIVMVCTAVATALAGADILWWGLTATPACVWLVTRPIALRAAVLR